MDVLVTYATRHGATAGIAERVGDRLRQHGVAAEVVPIASVEDVEDHDAVVIGGAIYLARWLRPATRFVRRHEEELARRPVWLFGCGPLGTEPTDEDGTDLREAARPREFDQLVDLVEPEDAAVFFGALDPEDPPVGLAERMLQLLPRTSGSPLPVGDFRDWDDIDAWADGIAARLDEIARDHAIDAVHEAHTASE